MKAILLSALVAGLTVAPQAFASKGGGGGDPLANDFLKYGEQIRLLVAKGRLTGDAKDAEKIGAQLERIKTSLDGKSPALSFPDASTLDCFGVTKVGCVNDQGDVAIARQGFQALSPKLKLEVVALELYKLTDLEGRYELARRSSDLLYSQDESASVQVTSQSGLEFGDAQSAFDAGRIPTVQDLVSQKFKYLGTTNNPTTEIGKDEYRADGEFLNSEGNFQHDMYTVDQTTDAFGKPIVTINVKTFESATGKIVFVSDSKELSISSAGVFWFFKDKQKGDDTHRETECGSKTELRLGANNTLIAGTTNTSIYKTCRDFGLPGGIAHFRIFKVLPR